MSRRGKVIVLRSLNKNFDSIENMLARLKVAHSVVMKRDFMNAMDETLDGRSVAAVGTEPIMFMRDFQRSGQLPDALVSLMRAPRR